MRVFILGDSTPMSYVEDNTPKAGLDSSPVTTFCPALEFITATSAVTAPGASLPKASRCAGSLNCGCVQKTQLTQAYTEFKL